MTAVAPNYQALFVAAVAIVFVILYGIFVFRSTRHTVIPVIIYGSLAAFLAVVFGTIVVPYLSYAQPPPPAELRPYNVAELLGRGIYLREGCWYCHSQFVRPNDRDLGPVAEAGDYYYDSPAALGTERTGPDLSYVGGRFPDEYHRRHHTQPRDTRPGSLMAPFPFLNEKHITAPAKDLEGAIRYGRGLAWPLKDVLDLPAQVDRRDADRPMAIDSHLRNEVYSGRYVYYSGEYKWGSEPEEDGKIHLYLRDPRRPEGREDLPEGKFAQNGWRWATEMDVLVTYLQSLGTRKPIRPHPDVPNEYWFEMDPKTNKRRVREAPPAISYTSPASLSAAPNKFRTMGRGIFMGKCAHCHGNQGAGDGPAGRDWVKRPANFTEAKFRDYPEAKWFWRVSEGVPGTQMPQWKINLTEEQRWYLVRYLQSVAKARPELVSGWSGPALLNELKERGVSVAPDANGVLQPTGPADEITPGLRAFINKPEIRQPLLDAMAAAGRN